MDNEKAGKNKETDNWRCDRVITLNNKSGPIKLDTIKERADALYVIRLQTKGVKLCVARDTIDPRLGYVYVPSDKPVDREAEFGFMQREEEIVKLKERLMAEELEREAKETREAANNGKKKKKSAEAVPLAPVSVPTNQIAVNTELYENQKGVKEYLIKELLIEKARDKESRRYAITQGVRSYLRSHIALTHRALEEALFQVADMKVAGLGAREADELLKLGTDLFYNAWTRGAVRSVRLEEAVEKMIRSKRANIGFTVTDISYNGSRDEILYFTNEFRLSSEFLSSRVERTVLDNGRVKYKYNPKGKA